MRAFLFICMSFILSFNSFAASAGHQNLVQVFDDYHYAVTVDWDQKDEKKLGELTDEFYKNLNKLTLEKGLNLNEIEKLLSSRVQNSAALEAAKLKLRLLGPNPDQGELIKFLKEEGRNLYSQGASWNGDVVAMYAFGIVFVALAAYAIYFRLTHDCVRWEEDRDELICTYDERPCGIYDTCGTQRCYYSEYCAEWVKK